MSDNFTQQHKLVERITSGGWFTNPSGRQGYEVIVLQQTGNGGTRYYCSLKPGETLHFGERLFNKFIVLAVDIRHARSFQIEEEFQIRQEDYRVRLRINVRYRVMDPRIVALETVDPLGELRDKVIASLNRELSRLPKEYITPGFIEGSIREIGPVPQLGLLAEDAEVIEFVLTYPRFLTFSEDHPSYQRPTVSIEDAKNAVILYDLLRVKIALPALLKVDEFFDNVVDKLRAIEFIYSIYALLNSNDPEAAEKFITYLTEANEKTTLSQSLLDRLLITANVEPLRLNSVHYGSPASFDLLGLGKVLEILRDTLKDLAWRGKHEKQMADLERKNKQVEINKARLDTERAAVELVAEKLELDKLMIAKEKMLVEIVEQKLGLIQKATNLELPDDQKRLIISVLIPKMIIISEDPITPLLKSQQLASSPTGETAEFAKGYPRDLTDVSSSAASESLYS